MAGKNTVKIEIICVWGQRNEVISCLEISNNILRVFIVVADEARGSTHAIGSDLGGSEIRIILTHRDPEARCPIVDTLFIDISSQGKKT